MPSQSNPSQLATHSGAKRERRKAERPGELLQAALELFVEKGYAATRVDAVAQRAGVSKGTLFLYFPSKEELFKAVVRENLSGRFAEWNLELETYQGNSAELLHYCMSSWWKRIGSTPASGISKLMMGEAANFPELARFYQDEVVQPGIALIRRILQRGVERGEFRAFDPDYGVYSILAHLMFLSTWKHSLTHCSGPGMAMSPEQYIESQVWTLLYGLSNAPRALTGSPER
jgi:TetR/AcrR family transcriptional regulator